MENSAARSTANGLDWRWRPVDIIVAAVLGVAFGIVFFVWNNFWAASTPAFTFLPPLQALLYGMWFFPAVLGGLVIRKPGAAVYVETVAAFVSVLFGAPTPVEIVIYGVAQGLLAELVFLAVFYRRWGLGIAAIAGAFVGVGPGIMDPIRYYPTFSTGFRIIWLVAVVVSGAVIAGVGSWLLVRALRPTGVLAPFASGRTDDEPAEPAEP